MQFSLFFFANHPEGIEDGGKYDLVFDAARWADRNGFDRLWVPERHFHSFGGLSPNPSVLAAALAAVTERIQLCAGSVVLPLHDPIRVAEEWSVVDNISGGRVGLGVACGWAPNDFVIGGHQADFETRKEVFADKIATLQKLWRGDPHVLADPFGKPFDAHVVPRPIQKEAPLWITAAANPETFRQAGELGVNLLTHLLGQTLKNLKEKIAVYREAWARAGHPGAGTVTLMLHTLVGDSDEEVHQIARDPMKAYLGASLNLAAAHLASVPFIRNPLEIDVAGLTPDVADQTLEASYEKYFHMASLMGSYEKCLETIARVEEAGVDETACLIDFGLESEVVLEGLENLNVVKRLAGPRPLRASAPERQARAS